MDVPKPRKSPFKSIFFYGFFSIFPLAGLGVLGLAIQDLNQGRPNGWFGLGFSGVWLLACPFVLWVMIRSNREAADHDSNFVPYQARRPGQREERIRNSTTAGGILIGTVVSLVFGGAGLACLIGSLRSVKMEGRNMGIVLGSVFLVIGVLFLIGVITAIVHRRKFGIASLRLTQPAARIGGLLAGVLEVPTGILRDHRFKVRLTCTRITRTHQRGGDRQDSLSRESLWIGEQIQRPALKRPDGGMELPLTFTIPAGLPKSCDDAYPRVEWRVDVTASVPGLDFRESFPVQVSDGSDAEPFATDERNLPSRSVLKHPTGSSPFQAQPDWAAGRIEADRRVGPVWPGMAGIGTVPLGAAGFLAAARNVARHLHRILSALVIFVVVAFIASTFTRGHGLDFLESIPAMLPSLMHGWMWVAAPVGGCLVLAAGLTTWHRYWHLHRFGISFLRLATLPIQAGTTMKGTLEVPRSVVPQGGFSFRLLRVRTRWFGGGIVGPAAETGWKGDWITFEGYAPGDESTEVPFELPVPAQLPESGRGEVPWQWYVEVSAAVPGLDFIARFIVPVQHVE
ncbi:MAG: hypothetical protein RIS76_2865 [Verrucomicrobiota bacterium]